MIKKNLDFFLFLGQTPESVTKILTGVLTQIITITTYSPLLIVKNDRKYENNETRSFPVSIRRVFQIRKPFNNDKLRNTENI